MKPKEVKAILATNPGKPLYASYTADTNVGSVGFFDPISKTTAIRNARAIQSAKFGTYREFRPDLERHFLPGSPQYDYGARAIIVFAFEVQTRQEKTV